jgi:phosphoribosylanthranilate isomerase
MKSTNDDNNITGNDVNLFKAPRIKVCGMTDLKQMHKLGEMGVEFAGMIFYHKSPRFIMRHLKGYEVKKAKLKVFKIGVFVNASYDEVMNHVDNFGLDMVQLHGNETPYYCSRLSSYISVIKAFRIAEDDNIAWKIKIITRIVTCSCSIQKAKALEEQEESLTGKSCGAQRYVNHFF